MEGIFGDHMRSRPNRLALRASMYVRGSKVASSASEPSKTLVSSPSSSISFTVSDLDLSDRARASSRGDLPERTRIVAGLRPSMGLPQKEEKEVREKAETGSLRR